MSDEAKIQQWGWLRRVVRWLVTLYYPRIEISGRDQIRQTGPVLLCANHSNSLIDPVMIGLAARRPVRFLAKAPLFENPIVGPPMQALGMVPAYRGSDDSSQVKRNLESLEVSAQVLADGSAMGIFPEGQSTDQAHLEMIRSGAARMALQAVELGAHGLHVVPMGLTYERKERFRSSILIRIAEPINVEDLLQANGGDDRKARREFTSELQRRLKSVVVHLNDPQWEDWLEDLEILLPSPPDVHNTLCGPLWQRKRIADAINHFLETDRPRAEAVAQQMKEFRDSVHAAGLSVDSRVLHEPGLSVFLGLVGNLCWLILLFPIALLGTVYHLIPFVVVRKIAARMDQPGRKTISTHRMLVGVPIYLLWYLSVTALLITVDARLAWGSLIAAPFCGLVAIHYWRRALEMSRLLYHQLRVTLARHELHKLRQQLTELRGPLTELSEEFASISPRSEQR